MTDKEPPTSFLTPNITSSPIVCYSAVYDAGRGLIATGNTATSLFRCNVISDDAVEDGSSRTFEVDTPAIYIFGDIASDIAIADDGVGP